MSAGPFVVTSYEADYGLGTAVHPIKVQPETVAATIGAIPNQIVPAPAINNPISAQVSSSTRSLGLHARIVRLKNPLQPPAGYSAGSQTQIPALTKRFYTEAQILGATCQYLGTTWEVSGSRSEKAR